MESQVEKQQTQNPEVEQTNWEEIPLTPVYIPQKNEVPLQTQNKSKFQSQQVYQGIQNQASDVYKPPDLMQNQKTTQIEENQLFQKQDSETFDQQDEQKQYPQQIQVPQTFQYNYGIRNDKSGIGTLNSISLKPYNFLFAATILFWGTLLWKIFVDTDFEQNIIIENYITEGILGIVYIVNWFEFFRSDILRQLRNLKNPAKIRDYILQAQQVKPLIKWKIETSHSIPPIGRSGKNQEVVSSAQEALFQYEHWKDVSSTTTLFEKFNIVKINFHNQIVLNDEITLKIRNKKREDYFKLNDSDSNIQFSETIELEGFNEKFLVAYSDRKHLPWWFDKVFYFLLTMIMFQWMYRILYNARIGDIQYTFVKIIQRHSEVLEGAIDAPKIAATNNKN